MSDLCFAGSLLHATCLGFAAGTMLFESMVFGLEVTLKKLRHLNEAVCVQKGQSIGSCDNNQCRLSFSCLSDISFTIAVDSDVPAMLVGDPARLEQLLQILIDVCCLTRLSVSHDSSCVLDAERCQVYAGRRSRHPVLQVRDGDQMVTEL